MFWAVIIPFVAAFFAPLICRLSGRGAGWILTGAPLMALVLIAMRLEPGAAVAEGWEWVPSLDVQMWFRLDGLSGTFAVLIAGIGALVTLYAAGYMNGQPRVGSFYLYLLLFMGSMLGLVLADDMISMFVFWELTSITSFLLIGFDHEDRKSRDAALQALLVTATGGLALLAGLLLLALAAVDGGLAWSEALRFSALAQVDLPSHHFYTPAVILILLGAFTKSAQWPFHFWLPSAMAAPTPVSAYLHSATLVKAGIYLMARLNPALGDTPLWSNLLITFGAITMVYAVIMAAGQTDLKRILAFTTVSVLGTLTMLIGIGSEMALTGAVVFLVAHALYKAALFMVAGNIDHSTGTRDPRQLGGLRKVMPMTAAAGALAMLSMAGVPPLLGFMGKELVYEAELGVEGMGGLLVSLAVVANALMVAMALLVGVRPFWGPARPGPRKPHEVPLSMWIGPGLLALGGLMIGIVPGPFARTLGTDMARAIAGELLEPMTLKLWHGTDPQAILVLGLSMATLVLGFVLFVKADPLGRIIGAAERRWRGYGSERGYERIVDGLTYTARLHTRIMQHGYLRFYLLVVLSTVIVVGMGPAVLAAFREYGDPPMDWSAEEHKVFIQEGVALSFIIVGAFAALLSRAWLTGIVWLGVVGLGVTLVFFLFGAPDLAMTQIMIETLTVILFVLIFYYLPPSKQRTGHLRRVSDTLVAVFVGCTMGMLVFAAGGLEVPQTLREYYGSQSLPQGHGRNVVNVILVDFRALDTFGEITVVAVAGIGVYALLKLLPLKQQERRSEEDLP